VNSHRRKSSNRLVDFRFGTNAKCRSYRVTSECGGEAENISHFDQKLPKLTAFRLVNRFAAKNMRTQKPIAEYPPTAHHQTGSR